MNGQLSPPPARVVFCCTANRIRSVFAERATRQLHLLPRWLGDLPVASRGLLATAGLPAMPEAIAAAKQLGVSLADHLSKPLLPADCAGAWLIGMTREHLRCETGPRRRDLLGDFAGIGEIPDPVGLSVDTHRRVFEDILTALHAWSRSPSP